MLLFLKIFIIWIVVGSKLWLEKVPKRLFQTVITQIMFEVFFLLMIKSNDKKVAVAYFKLCVYVHVLDRAF